MFRLSRKFKELALLCFGKNARVKKLYYSTIPGSLISCTQLEKCIENAPALNYRILDASWDLDGGDYKSRHFESRIHGAKFFSFDECCDKSSAFPRMLPSKFQFEDYVTALSISNDDHVIVYDNLQSHGSYSAPRVWWMFRTFGHDNVSVLDGGFSKWLQDGYPTICGEYTENEVISELKFYSIVVFVGYFFIAS